MTARHAAAGPKNSAASMALALLVYALCVGASMLPTRGVPSRAGCLVSAGIAGAGSVVVALLLVRHSGELRRASLIAATLLAALMLLTPFTAGSPALWRDHVRPLLWLVPWLALVTAGSTGGSRQTDCAGACPPTARVAGSLLIVQALVLGGILLAIGPVSRLLKAAR